MKTSFPYPLIRLLIILLLASGCGTNPPATTEISLREEDPDQEAWNTTIYLSENGLQRVVVTAAHRMHFTNEQRTVMDEGMHVDFYDEDGRLASTLTADQGIIDEQSHDMTVIGNVVIVSLEYGTLKTDSLRWIETDNRFRTEARVHISTSKDVITGSGFEADPGLSRWEIFRDVRGQFDRGDELSRQFDESETPP